MPTFNGTTNRKLNLNVNLHFQEQSAGWQSFLESAKICAAVIFGLLALILPLCIFCPPGSSDAANAVPGLVIPSVIAAIFGITHGGRNAWHHCKETLVSSVLRVGACVAGSLVMFALWRFGLSAAITLLAAVLLQTVGGYYGGKALTAYIGLVSR